MEAKTAPQGVIIASEFTHWLAGTHGPSGEHLVALVRNSDAVLNAFMLMANRSAPIMVAKLTDLQKRLLEAAEDIGRQI